MLQRLRAESKLNQEKFAQKIGVKTSQLQKWELEKVEPTVHEAKKLERMFNVKLLAEQKQEDDEASLTTDEIQKFRANKGASMGDFIKVRKKKE